MIGSLVGERDCRVKIMASSVEASGPCRAKTCCLQRRLAGAAHNSSTSNLQSVNTVVSRMHAYYKDVSLAELDTQWLSCECWSAGEADCRLPSLIVRPMPAAAGHEDKWSGQAIPTAALCRHAQLWHCTEHPQVILPVCCRLLQPGLQCQEHGSPPDGQHTDHCCSPLCCHNFS